MAESYETNLVSIDIEQVEYKNEMLDEVQKQELSQDFRNEMAALLSTPNLPYETLIQKNKAPALKGIDMLNTKNMGYEGFFWFGNPS